MSESLIRATRRDKVKRNERHLNKQQAALKEIGLNTDGGDWFVFISQQIIHI